MLVLGFGRAAKAGNGLSCLELEAFVRELALQDRSPATVRSYRQGVEHFLRWLSAGGVALDEVSTRVIGDYVEAFKAGAKEGAVAVGVNAPVVVDERTGKASPSPRRKPRTVNHRLSVLVRPRLLPNAGRRRADTRPRARRRACLHLGC